MEKEKIKIRLSTLILFCLAVILVSFSIVTFAWFKDKKAYSSNLSFGNIELDIKSGVNNANKTLSLNIARSGATKLMPGDTININLGIGLSSISEPAYYKVYLYDDKGIFEESSYFMENSVVYDENKQNTENKYVGKITKDDTHNISLQAKVSEDYFS